jgi:hypothetical protein
VVVVYGLMALGGFRGLSGDSNMAGVAIAGVLGVLVAAGAVFGAIYKVPSPTNLVPLYAVGWIVLGILVTAIAKGREPASQVLTDLSSTD